MSVSVDSVMIATSFHFKETIKMRRFFNRLFTAPKQAYGVLALPGQGGKKSAPAAVAVLSASASLLLAANGARTTARIQNNHATTILYIGGDSTVSSANGIALAAGAAWEDRDSTDAWYGRQASGTGDARVYEVTH
jgi:hypothetical protein